MWGVGTTEGDLGNEKKATVVKEKEESPHSQRWMVEGGKKTSPQDRGGKRNTKAQREDKRERGKTGSLEGRGTGYKKSNEEKNVKRKRSTSMKKWVKNFNPVT